MLPCVKQLSVDTFQTMLFVPVVTSDPFPQVLSYKSKSDDPVCKAIVRPEMKYLDHLRSSQMRFVIKTLRENPGLAQQLGPVGIPIDMGNPIKLRDIIKRFRTANVG